LDGSPRAADVVATKDTTLLRMRGADFRALVNSDANINCKLMHQLIAEVRVLTQRVYEFSVLKVQSRVQKRILELARKAQPVGDTVLLEQFPKHSEIASRVATTREAVTREISRLVELGLLERVGKGLRIPSLARFALLVETSD
ncbi:MAG: Crp/Fnr family transcriptional regulator, partial [Pseudomonadales bacterium]